VHFESVSDTKVQSHCTAGFDVMTSGASGCERRMIVEEPLALLGLMPRLEVVNAMGQTGSGMKQQKSGASATKVNYALEVQVIPVSDVERSKQFYARLGWRFDADLAPTDGVRIVQFTPPGSGCSVWFGMGLTAASPGSAEAMLVVSDIDAAREEIIARGIDAHEVWHGASFPREARLSGRDPKRTSYGSFFSFNDPDHNTWLVQEVTARLPGRT
jgi:predicted enzyme related to lactoylglutathione lyase